MRALSRLAALFLLGSIWACGQGWEPVQLNIGAQAPTFESRFLDDTTARFPDAHAGKPVVIRFWADWCRYCEGEMKAIDRVYLRHAGRGLQVLAVNAGQDKAAVAAFMRKLGVSYPAVLDENSAIARRYGVTGLPTTFFVDANGRVIQKIVGEADEAVFEQAIASLLK